MGYSTGYFSDCCTLYVYVLSNEKMVSNFFSIDFYNQFLRNLLAVDLVASSIRRVQEPNKIYQPRPHPLNHTHNKSLDTFSVNLVLLASGANLLTPRAS